MDKRGGSVSKVLDHHDTCVVFRLIETVLIHIIPVLSWSGSSGGASMGSGTSRSSTRMRPCPRSSLPRSLSPSVWSLSSLVSRERSGRIRGWSTKGERRETRQVFSPPMSSFCQRTFKILTFTWPSSDFNKVFELKLNYMVVDQIQTLSQGPLWGL